MKSDLVLIESRSARTERLEGVDNSRALEIVNRAKSLVMALWQGTGIATTAQMADYYEVPEDTIQSVIKNNRQEFEENGLEVLRGKRLKDVVSFLDTTSKAPSLTAWNPRCALLLGLLLTGSDIAKAVRTVVLDIATVIPAQNDRLRELEQELQVLQLKEKLLLTSNAIATLHGTDTLALILGKPEAVITKTEVVRETVMVDETGHPVASFDGVGITELARRYHFGTTPKGIAACRGWLARVGIKEEQWQGQPSIVNHPKLPRELLKFLDTQMQRRAGDRQLLIGEEGAMQ